MTPSPHIEKIIADQARRIADLERALKHMQSFLRDREFTETTIHVAERIIEMALTERSKRKKGRR